MITIRKYVDVQTAVGVDVELTLQDAFEEISDDELMKECVKRGLIAEPRDKSDSYLVSKEALETAAWRLSRGEIEDAVFVIEGQLPRPFRGLTYQILTQRTKGAPA